MLHFLYDSLEAVKKITIPKTKDFITITIATIVMILAFGIFFIGADTVFSGLYQLVYHSIRG